MERRILNAWARYDSKESDLSAYPQNHEPVHVHGFYAEGEGIVELRETAREVALASRSDAVRPGNASRSDIKHVLSVAAARFDELIQLWREARA